MDKKDDRQVKRYNTPASNKQIIFLGLGLLMLVDIFVGIPLLIWVWHQILQQL
jgi:hypothetical protein